MSDRPTFIDPQVTLMETGKRTEILVVVVEMWCGTATRDVTVQSGPGVTGHSRASRTFGGPVNEKP